MATSTGEHQLFQWIFVFFHLSEGLINDRDENFSSSMFKLKTAEELYALVVMVSRLVFV